MNRTVTHISSHQTVISNWKPSGLFAGKWLRAPDLNQQYYGFPAIAHVECFSRVVIEQGLALRSMRNCWRTRDRDETRVRIPLGPPPLVHWLRHRVAHSGRDAGDDR